MYRSLLNSFDFSLLSSWTSSSGSSAGGGVPTAADASAFFSFLAWYAALHLTLSFSLNSAALLLVRMLYHHCSVHFLLNHFYFSSSVPSMGKPSRVGATICFLGLPFPLPIDIDWSDRVKDDCKKDVGFGS